MKIYFSPFSPYVRKCLVMAYELGLNDELELLDSNAHPVNRDMEISEHNPFGQVPTFFTSQGQPLFDSRVICEYLNSVGKGALFPAEGDARWTALTQQALADGILDCALQARYEEVARPDEKKWQDWANANLSKIASALNYLEQKKLPLTQEATTGTLSIGCALWYLDLRFESYDWRTDYPYVASWYSEFSQRDSMKNTWSLD